MSHDFAKGKDKGSNKKRPAKKPMNTRKTPEKKRLPGWAFFLCGVAFTLFAQLLYHLAQVDTKTPDDEPQSATKQKTQEVTKPVYDFYEKLKTMEVPVPDDVVDEREQENYNYALQAGSFKNRKDADQQRAEIILLGLDATIETRKSESGTTWHRIIVGPFTSRSKLNKARSMLIDNDLPTITIKRDG